MLNGDARLQRDQGIQADIPAQIDGAAEQHAMMNVGRRPARILPRSCTDWPEKVLEAVRLLIARLRT